FKLKSGFWKIFGVRYLLVPKKPVHNLDISAAQGLFDASLNYLWDAVEVDIRKKVEMYDTHYFISTLPNGTKYKQLDDVPAAELIDGAKQVEILSNAGYIKIAHLKNLRNQLSTAHPTFEKVGPYELLSGLESAIEHVFNVKPSTDILNLPRLATQIKSGALNEPQIDAIKASFYSMSEKRLDSLVSILFDIFADEKQAAEVRSNIQKLVPVAWSLSDEALKERIGNKAGVRRLNGTSKESELTNQFLDIVKGEKYLPQTLKEAEIVEILDDLKSAHVNMNNFYSEPSYAKQLERFSDGGIELSSTSLNKKYVITLITVFLTNGSGTAWNADAIYKRLLNQLTENQILLAALSFVSEEVESKLNWSLSQKKFSEMLDILADHAVGNKTLEIIRALKNLGEQNYKVASQNSTITRQYTPLIKEYYPEVDM
ncbi:hypothetical protein, partial [Weissella cibaria]|uniref:hypothetical protein n=1 Tax=Weissella cibaria TaxID=137591 RepID=UPI002A750DF8